MNIADDCLFKYFCDFCKIYSYKYVATSVYISRIAKKFTHYNHNSWVTLQRQ